MGHWQRSVQGQTLQGGVTGKNWNFNGVKLCVKSFLAPLGRYLQSLITLREKERTVAHRWLFHWPTVKGTKTGNAGNSFSLHRFSINLQINVTWTEPADHRWGEEKKKKAENPTIIQTTQTLAGDPILQCNSLPLHFQHHIRFDTKTTENKHAKTQSSTSFLFSSLNPVSREKTEALTSI